MKARLILDDKLDYENCLFIEQLSIDSEDVVSIHPSQIDEVILFLLAHKKQVEGMENNIGEIKWF